MKFEKIFDMIWASDIIYGTGTIQNRKKQLMETYIDAKLEIEPLFDNNTHSIYRNKDREPWWLYIEFFDETDEAEFILRESVL